MVSEDPRAGESRVQPLARTLGLIARRLPSADFDAFLDLVRQLRLDDGDERYEASLRALSGLLTPDLEDVQPFVEAEERMSPRMKRWTEHVGVRIRELRTKAGMTQKQLAHATGLTQAHISRMENADLSATHLTLAKIARVLEGDSGPLTLVEEPRPTPSTGTAAQVGKRIRALRKKAGMTQADLARACGVDSTYISRLEHGDHSAKYPTLARIAKALGVTADEIDPCAA